MYSISSFCDTGWPRIATSKKNWICVKLCFDCLFAFQHISQNKAWNVNYFVYESIHHKPTRVDIEKMSALSRITFYLNLLNERHKLHYLDTSCIIYLKAIFVLNDLDKYFSKGSYWDTTLLLWCDPEVHKFNMCNVSSPVYCCMSLQIYTYLLKFWNEIKFKLAHEN